VENKAVGISILAFSYMITLSLAILSVYGAILPFGAIIHG
jgi:hypothetical protein